jgi:hypothetical protein
VLAAGGGLDVAAVVLRSLLEALDEPLRVLADLVRILSRDLDVASPARLTREAALATTGL